MERGANGGEGILKVYFSTTRTSRNVLCSSSVIKSGNFKSSLCNSGSFELVLLLCSFKVFGLCYGTIVRQKKGSIYRLDKNFKGIIFKGIAEILYLVQISSISAKLRNPSERRKNAVLLCKFF